MTLYRQLLIAILLGFVLIVAGIEAIYVASARGYLQDQMESHSQDAATALGLSLATALATDDAVLANSIVGAAFDRGYYREIRVTDARGKTLVLRQLPPTPPEVPAWFAGLLHLETPATESLITTGWRSAGRVVVTSLPNFAYRQLWDTAWASLAWVVALFAGAVFLAVLYLRTILRPLEQIELAARTIGERNFVRIEAAPRSRELRRVVQTINALSDKVREMLDQEVARANEWRRQAFADPVTGLDNRRGFEQQVADMLAAIEVARGALFIVELNEFKAFNERAGFHRGDELLAAIGASLNQARQGVSLCARIGGATFAIFALNMSREAAAVLSRHLCRDIEDLLAEHGNDITFQCGGACFETSTTLTALLSVADMALEQSRQRGANASLLLDSGPGSPDERGSTYWKRLIQSAVEEDRILLFAQPVVAARDGRPLQTEIMGRIADELDFAVPAAQFMPMAARHDLAARFDLAIASHVMQWLQTVAAPVGSVSINLSFQTLRDAAIRERIATLLAAAPALAARLVFEVAEFALTHDMAAAEAFAAAVRRHGAGFAVDNFGLHRSAFEYLTRIKPDYIKLSPSLTAAAATDASQRMFVCTVIGIARPLDIAVYAGRVESEELAAALRELGIDGYQGHLSGAPQPVDL